MSRPLPFLLFAASLTLAFESVHAMSQSTATPANAAPHAAAKAAPLGANPFFKPSPLPFQYPAFDRIKNAHFAPAFAIGMRQRLAEINAIANNPKPATFDNTIAAMERGGRLLTRVATAFENLKAANTNDAMQALERTLAPQLSAHSDRIMLNAKLFQRVKALHSKRDTLGLDAESAQLLERYHKDFVRAGAELGPDGKTRLKAMNGELAVLEAAFSQNVMKESNADALLADRGELAGLSEAQLATAAAAAKAAGKDGKYLLPLVNTTGHPALAQLSNRATRERLLQASLRRGSHGGAQDNREAVLKMARLRAERARLLGFPTHAAYALDDETAANPDNVNSLLAELAPAAVANARREAQAIGQLAAQENAAGGSFELAAHDWDYYAEKVRLARYDFDEAQLSPYLELDGVLKNGVFFAAGKLYGLSFKERHDLPVYDPSVRVFDVADADGKPLAIFIADFYARGNKRGGAWMNAYVPQNTMMGEPPVIANHLNIPKPAPGQPTLLTFDEVRTMFHEFGHALHGILSKVRYPRFSGTNVPRDFVEFPSQVNEMWAVWPEVLQNYARHHKTGEQMPQALISKVLAARQFNQGFSTTEYLAACLLDQRWHQLAPEQIPADVLAFEATALKDAGVDFAPVPPRYRSTYFTHVFSGGYSAGYYAYLWSEKLDADTVEWFKENGGLTRQNGDRFRQRLLAHGGSADAMALYRSFRGRDAKIGPLLERRGLVQPAAAGAGSGAQ